jgi:methyl-accepting chemotaxis protein
MATSESETNRPDPGATPDQPQQAAGGAHLERFAKAFEASARRWELVVYPSLFAFIVLAAYGFFLVYSLTKDMRVLSDNVDPEMHRHMSTMTRSIDHLAQTISVMNETVASMAESMKSMDARIGEMKNDTGAMSASTASMVTEMARVNAQMSVISTKLNALDPIVINMAAMNEHMKAMTISMGLLSRDIGRPMNFMNQFAPW